MPRLGFFARRRFKRALIEAQASNLIASAGEDWIAIDPGLDPDALDWSWWPRPLPSIMMVEPTLPAETFEPLPGRSAGPVVLKVSPAVLSFWLTEPAAPGRVIWLGASPAMSVAMWPDAVRFDWLAARLVSGDASVDSGAPNMQASRDAEWRTRAHVFQPSRPHDGVDPADVGSAFASDATLARVAQWLPASRRRENGFCERFREYHEKGWPILYAPFTESGEEAFAVATLFALLRQTSALLLLAPRGTERHEPVYRDLIKYRLPIIRHNRLMTSFVPRKNRLYYIEDDATAESAVACADAVFLSPTLVARSSLTSDDRAERMAAILALVEGPSRPVNAAGGGAEGEGYRPQCLVGPGLIDAPATAGLADAIAMGITPAAADPEVLAACFLASWQARQNDSNRDLRSERDRLRERVKTLLWNDTHGS